MYIRNQIKSKYNLQCGGNDLVNDTHISFKNIQNNMHILDSLKKIDYVRYICDNNKSKLYLLS